MTVRELRHILFDIKNQDAEIEIVSAETTKIVGAFERIVEVPNSSVIIVLGEI